jgi:putative transposase
VKKSRFTEEQISFALKQAETGTPVAEVIRRMGISEQTFYRWKKLYGGLGTRELRRLKQLGEENRKLSSSSRTSASTSASCRMFCQKSSEAWSAARTRAAGSSSPRGE